MSGAIEAAGVQACGKPTWDVINLSAGFICTRADYFCELEDNLQALKNEISRLQDLVMHVLSRIEGEDLQRMQKRYEVKDWFTRVDQFQIDVLPNIIDADEEIENKCIRCFCPKNRCSCSRVGIRVCNKLEGVRQLLTDGNFVEVMEAVPHAENGVATMVMNLALRTGRTIKMVWSAAAGVQA